jgi:hypothetical protein
MDIECGGVSCIELGLYWQEFAVCRGPHFWTLQDSTRWLRWRGSGCFKSVGAVSRHWGACPSILRCNQREVRGVDTVFEVLAAVVFERLETVHVTPSFERGLPKTGSLDISCTACMTIGSSAVVFETRLPSSPVDTGMTL